MASPYGGDRGGGKKPTRKRGGQPGNVNRRGAELLPPAKNTEERRAFLDALQNAESLSASEQARLVRNYGFARLVSLVEHVGLQKMLRFLSVLDGHRITEAKIGKAGEAVKREATKDQALGEIWKICGACESCSEQVDQVLAALQLQLLGLQPSEVSDGVDEQESSR
jgi:bacterioferritin-associated ferredoxin